MNIQLLYKKLINSPTFTTWLSYLSKSFNLLIIIPLLLKKLNPNDIAFWYLFLNIIGIQLLIEAGFSNTFIRMFSYGMKGNRAIINQTKEMTNKILDKGIDKDFIASIFEVMKIFYYKISIVLTIFFVFLGFWFFRNPIENSSNPTYGWYVWIVTILCIPIIVFGGIFSNILQGMNKIPLLRMWETIFNFFSSFFSIIILIYYPNVFLLSLSMLFWIVISVFRNYIVYNQNFKSYLGKVDKSILKDITKNTISNSLKSGFGVFFAQGITYLISFYYALTIPSNLLAAYLLGVNLVLNIRNFAQAPFYSKIPYFSMLSAEKDFVNLKKTSQRSMFIVYFLFLFFSILVWLLGDHLLVVLNKKSAFPSLQLWSLLVFGFFIERFGAMHIQLYSTSNHILWHIQNGITGAIVLFFTFILFEKFNILSYPIALILGNSMFYSWYGPYKSYALLKTSFWEFDKVIFFPFLMLSLLLLIWINFSTLMFPWVL